jgi:predicted RNA-binding Zn ribbon-like protein
VEKAVASKSGEKRFQRVAGHPALDFVNTLDWRFREGSPEELITDYDDLVQFAVQCGLIHAAESHKLLRRTSANRAAQAVAEARGMREAAARIFYAAVDGEGPPAEAIRELEVRFKEAETHRELRWSEKHLHWEFPAALVAPELPVWLLTLETAQLVTAGEMGLVRACGDPECRWLFVDTSKNHTRRWCDMKICGNRMKARRFKAQHGK